MKIGELARRVGVNPKTLRYWEEIGLLEPPARDASGYRDYSEEYLEMCRFILKAKRLGFTLEEIKEIVFIIKEGKEPCGCVEEKIKDKIRDIEVLILELSKKKNLLLKLLEERRTESAVLCPIIESIE